MKEQIITFKVDKDLGETLDKIPNKSEFIRNSILEALGNKCPLCGGTGNLTESQRRHWDSFLEHHSVEICDECNEVHIVCSYVQG